MDEVSMNSRGPGAPTTAAASSRKKTYRRPEILDWGSVVDLTLGPTVGLGDRGPGLSGGGFREPPFPPFPPA